MLKKIISGGQTGADQGALHGASIAGIETGGTAPKGWQTERGPNPSLLKHYNLCQFQYFGYAARTLENIRAADATLIFGKVTSSGSNLTLKICVEYNSPVRIIPWTSKTAHIKESYPAQQIANWIREERIETLNFAGNRESGNPGIHVAAKNFVIELIAQLRG